MDSFPLRIVPPRGGTIDVGTLLAYFGARLRAGDAQLSLLVDELERQRHSCTTPEEVGQ